MRKKSNLDCVGIIIALSALFISVWQGYETRKHHRLSMTPYLSVIFSLADMGTSDYAGLLLESSGLGPARLEYMIVTVDNEGFDVTKEDGWKNVMKKICNLIAPQENTDNCSNLKLRMQQINRVIRPNVVLTLLGVPHSQLPQERISELERILHKFDKLEFCFCSLYENECWKSEDVLSSKQSAYYETKSCKFSEVNTHGQETGTDHSG